MSTFFSQLVAWQRDHGRHGLPWQGTRDPYRVWLSEVMLQQTQVVTVLDYFPRFLQAFPTVADLAAAEQDAVLALWSGLGYYSRARNLHRCAQQVVAQWGGQFPDNSTDLASLPGIGPSTAAAIAAFCFGERHSILDANVQRVLSRLLAVEADLANTKAVKVLWQQADALIPAEASADDMVSYTQGLMDLGATVCTSRTAHCLLCPAQGECVAHQQGRMLDYPVRTKKLKRTAENWHVLVVYSAQGVWLQRRPEQGVWAGLYCPPMFATEDEALQALPAGAAVAFGEPFKHVLTHKDLYLHPIVVQQNQAPRVAGQWVQGWAELGLPAPMRKYLQDLGV